MIFFGEKCWMLGVYLYEVLVVMIWLMILFVVGLVFFGGLFVVGGMLWYWL